MKQIVVVTPTDARLGFALGGVVQATTVPAELPAMLRQLADEPETGVVIVDERLLTERAREEIAALERHWPGLVVVLPSPGKAVAAEEDYVLRLIRRAIGYQVRLNP
ncbi:MAG: ATPase [Gammaproteobacteria bacterium SG8_30]|jgi:V/A-type H+-transporting ATPase subunit F|nr:MAG: ATPase [Gammaproteobacteria bacterium SG8_30]